MMCISINIHSFSSVITNSSDMTFICPRRNSLEPIKEIIKDIMVVLNVDGEVEDYFDISFGIRQDWLEEKLADLKERKDNSPGDREYYEKEIEFLSKATGEEEGLPNQAIEIRIIPKNTDINDLGSRLQKLFGLGHKWDWDI